MAQETQLARIQYNMHTASEWASTNEALLHREIGYEIDTGRYKIGINSSPTPWNDLPYASTCVKTVQVTPESYQVATSTEGLEYYVATIPLAGITQYDVPVIDVALSADVDAAVLQLEAFQTISQVITTNGNLVLYNYNSAPEVNFTLNVIIR